MISHVHHVNLLVKDLELAMSRYRDQLGVAAFDVSELPGRNVRTARFRAGETWIVLVQPVGPGEPQRVLDRQGEGLFLLSLGVEDLDGAVAHLCDHGGAVTEPQPRTGLDGWRVIDLDPATISGGQLQLTEDNH